VDKIDDIVILCVGIAMVSIFLVYPDALDIRFLDFKGYFAASLAVRRFDIFQNREPIPFPWKFLRTWKS